MIEPNDMKIGKRYRDSEVNHTPWDAPEGMVGCSSRECGAQPGHPVYPRDEVWVVRHWTNTSTAGRWMWYCEQHEAGSTKPWKNDHLAPAELQP